VSSINFVASTEAELHAEEEKIRIELLRLEAIQRKAREEEEAKRKKAFEEAEARRKRDEEARKREAEEDAKRKREAEEKEAIIKKTLEDKEQTKEEKALEGDAEGTEALEGEGRAKTEKDKEEIEGEEQAEGVKELVEDKEGTDSLESKERVEEEEALGEAKGEIKLLEGEELAEGVKELVEDKEGSDSLESKEHVEEEEALGEARGEIKLLEGEELAEGEKIFEVDKVEIDALEADIHAEGEKALGEGKGEILEAKEPADGEIALAVDEAEMETLEAYEEAKGDTNPELLKEIQVLDDVPGSVGIMSSVGDFDAADTSQQISNSSLHQFPIIDCYATLSINSKEVENVCPKSLSNEKTFVNEIVEAIHVEKETEILKQKESAETLHAQNFDEDGFSLDKKDPDTSLESPYIKAEGNEKHNCESQFLELDTVGDIASEGELKIGLLDSNRKNVENNEEEILVLPATDNLNSLLAVKSAEDLNAASQEVSVQSQISRTEANKQNMVRNIDTYSSEAHPMLVPDNMIPGEDIQNSSPFDPQQKSAEYAQNNGPLALDFSPVTNITLMEEAVEHVEADGVLEAKKEFVSQFDSIPVVKSSPRIDAYDSSFGEKAHPLTNGVVIMKDVKSNEMIAENSEPIAPMDYTCVIAGDVENSIKIKTELRAVELDNFNQSRDNEETVAKMKSEFKQSLELAIDKGNDDAISADSLTGSLDGDERKSCVAADKVEGILDDSNAHVSPLQYSNTAIDMVVVEEESTLQDAKTIKDDQPSSPSQVLTSKNLETVSFSMVDTISAGEMSPSSSMGGSPERLHAAGKSNPIPHYARFRTISRNSYDRAYYTNTKENTEETR